MATPFAQVRNTPVSLVALVIIGVLFIAATTRAQDIRVAQEHSDTEPFELVISILEQSIARYGENSRLQWVDTTEMNQPRALRMLESCSADFDVYFSGYDTGREQRLLQVNFPLTMGLLGLRGFVTTADRAEALEADVQQAETWLIGSGRGWPDTRIMLENQFRVTQANYQNLWAMLEQGRFDVFQRGLQEAQLEIRQRSNELQLLNTVVMLYPLATVLYVNPCKPELKEQLEFILQSAYEIGLVQSIIYQNADAALAINRLADPSVRIIALKNTDMSDAFVTMIDAYWLPEIRQHLSH
ncbi:MAG: hypothetical protein ABJ000_19600 [Saccharospirillum sp.]|uniref:hypothetical protein n=1 Tax=Saccharospirillum sp. TaxID=2033801 RepID=UPI003299A52E